MRSRANAFILIVLSISIIISCNNGESKSKNEGLNVKKSKLAGSWYPANKTSLKSMLNGYLKKVNPTGRIMKNLGLIVPHAGYVYSGQTAAYAYRDMGQGPMGKQIKRVFIIAPSHYGNFRGFSTPDFTHYETPLGKVPLDLKIVKKIKNHSLHKFEPQAHIPEHAIEIQIPFLQHILKDFNVIPVLIGDLAESDYGQLSDLFGQYLNTEGTVFIISSDFAHCGQRFGYLPFKFKEKPTLEEYSKALKKLDSGAIEKIKNLDFEGFLKYTNDTQITICGRKPIALFLKMLEKVEGVSAFPVKYSTSIDASKDYQNTVSYAAIRFIVDKPIKGEKKKMSSKNEYSLTKEEKNVLLKLSRDTLKIFLSKNKYPDKKDYKITDSLKAKRGVFVTLHKKGSLRGCIGFIEGIKPVYEAVMENTVNAALEDPRFPNVKESELKDIDIEISVMTPLSIFKKAEEIEIGRDGLVISKGWNRGLLLPQVATEWKWDRVQFLEAVSSKAGLPKDSWKDPDAKLEKFSAIVFGEKE